MSASHFKDEFEKIMMLVQLAGRMEIDLAFIEMTISRAESIGPILHPSEFIKGAQNLEDQKAVLEYAAPFIRGARQTLERYGIV